MVWTNESFRSLILRRIMYSSIPRWRLTRPSFTYRISSFPSIMVSSGASSSWKDDYIGPRIPVHHSQMCTGNVQLVERRGWNSSSGNRNNSDSVDSNKQLWDFAGPISTPRRFGNRPTQSQNCGRSAPHTPLGVGRLGCVAATAACRPCSMDGDARLGSPNQYLPAFRDC